MSNRAVAQTHCRITRMKLKGGGATVEILRTPDAPSEVVSTLVEVLGIARQGKVGSFAMVFRVTDEMGENSWNSVWAIRSTGDLNHDGCSLLGNTEMLASRLREELLK